MSNNNDLDPAASTQMFRAFVDGATPNSPTPAVAQTGRSNTGMVIGIVAAVVVVIAVIAVLAL